jgi:hypothetical protein
MEALSLYALLMLCDRRLAQRLHPICGLPSHRSFHVRYFLYFSVLA